MKPQATKSDPPDSPAMIKEGHVQDRNLDKAGDRKAFRRLDGLAWLKERKVVSGLQVEAGRRLQDDYAISLREDAARSGTGKTDGGRGYDIPQSALDASKRVKAAIAVLPPELVTMTVLFLLPDFSTSPLSMGHVAAVTREHPRSIPLGVRAALSLLARHYGT